MGMKERKPARECALFLLEYSDRTEQEMRGKLTEREYLPDEIDEAINFLKEYRYIDDAEYAKRYIRVYSARKSARLLRVELERRGVDRELIALALEAEPVDEEEQLRLLLQKKGYQPGQRMEPAAYRKLTAALARKGYSYELIRQLVNSMAEPW